MTLDELFSVTSLTDSINKLPSVPTRVSSSGLFAEKGIKTTTAMIDVKNGRLVLVPDQDRAGDGVSLAASKRNAIPVKCAHLPVTSGIMPDEIQDVREFGKEGTDAGLRSQVTVINDKLQDMRNAIDATKEFHLVGALRGKVLDADGSVLVDWYDKFGVQKKAVSVPLGNAATNVRKACLDAKRSVEPLLGGAMVTGFKAYCGKDWFDAFTDHAKVKEAYANYQEAQDRLGGDMRSGFTFGGITFEEYNVTVSGQLFIPADVAQVFPVGTGLASIYFAPANYNEAVNTIGQSYYAKSEPRKMGKGWDLEAQSNPLAVFHYPEALVELKAV